MAVRASYHGSPIISLSSIGAFQRPRLELMNRYLVNIFRPPHYYALSSSFNAGAAAKPLLAFHKHYSKCASNSSLSIATNLVPGRKPTASSLGTTNPHAITSSVEASQEALMAGVADIATRTRLDSRTLYCQISHEEIYDHGSKKVKSGAIHIGCGRDAMGRYGGLCAGVATEVSE